MNLGFIILRHVRDKKTDEYWVRCYNSIRKFYPDNPITIIDDNSDYTFITDSISLHNVTVIQSEYPGRGELLPYYYFATREKMFDVACILHDSAFINAYIPELENVPTYKLLWHFKHRWDQVEDETRMIRTLNDEWLTKFYENKTKWVGCFGAMAVIHYNYLSYIHSRNNLGSLLPLVTTRFNRCSFERVIACLMQLHYKTDTLSILGEIHEYCPWELSYDQIENYSNLPIIKIWTGR
jgi:hypothetical protein